MALPISALGGVAAAVYSGKSDTTRYIASSADGTERVTFDVIQSLPAKGRWRHVVRATHEGPADAVTKVRPSTTMTTTFDHPADMNGAGVKSIASVLFNAFFDSIDEIAAGQQ